MKKLIFLSLFLFISTLAFSQAKNTKFFHKHLHGSINKILGIEADWYFDGDRVFGTYYYTKVGKPLTVKGKKRNDGTILLEEQSPEGKVTGRFRGKFVDSNTFKGQWSSPDKTRSFPVELSENYSASVSFVGYEYSETRSLTDKEESPACNVDFSYVFPAKNSGTVPESGFNLWFCQNLLPPNVNCMKKATILPKIAESPFREYQDLDFDEQEITEYPHMYNWTFEQSIMPVFNSQHIVSLEMSGYSYSGGAHGLPNCSFAVFDLKNAKPIDYSDLFATESKKELTELILSGMELYFETKTREELADILFDLDGVEPADNFYVNAAGIGFFYNVYEIAAYAVGPIEVFLSFKQIGHLIKPNSPIQHLLRKE